MPQTIHSGTADEKESVEVGSLAVEASEDETSSALRSRASELSRALAWLPSVRSSGYLTARWRMLAAKLRPFLHSLHASWQAPAMDDAKSLYENSTLLSAELQH